MDPPRHTRLRNIVGPLFTKRRAEDSRAGIEHEAARLLERIAAMTPPVDLVETYAMALPIHVICGVLDLPVEDAVKLRTWSDSFMSVTAASPADLRASAKQLRSYAEALVDERRADPRGGVLDLLVEASLTDARTVADDEGVLSRDELIRMIVGLIVAGHETTGVVISRGVLTLLRHPHVLDALRDEPGQWPSVVEEILRHDVPGHGGLLRVAPEDVVLPSGARINAGEVVMAVQSPANHDPAYFEDRTPSTQGVRRSRTSRSATGRTTASEHIWPGWSCRSRSRHSSTGFRTLAWPSVRSRWNGPPRLG